MPFMVEPCVGILQKQLRINVVPQLIRATEVSIVHSALLLEKMKYADMQDR